MEKNRVLLLEALRITVHGNVLVWGVTDGALFPGRHAHGFQRVGTGLFLGLVEGGAAEGVAQA